MKKRRLLLLVLLLAVLAVSSVSPSIAYKELDRDAECFKLASEHCGGGAMYFDCMQIK